MNFRAWIKSLANRSWIKSLVAVVMASPKPRDKARLSDLTGNKYDGDKMLTLEEVADLIDIPLATCRKQRSEGKFVPGFKIGKWLRFLRSNYSMA